MDEFSSINSSGTCVTRSVSFADTDRKKIKEVDPNLTKNEIERIATNYLKYASWFKEK